MTHIETKIQLAIPFHEDLFCSSYLATEMWSDDYYKLLSVIGDDYE